MGLKSSPGKTLLLYGLPNRKLIRGRIAIILHENAIDIVRKVVR